MTNLHDKSTSLDIAMHARAAQHITPEDKPMRVTVVDYSWQHPPRKPHPEKHGAPGGLVLLFAALIGVLVSLMVGHVLVKAVAKAAAHSAGVEGAW